MKITITKEKDNEKRKEEERPFINDDKFIGFADYYERLEKYETKHFALKNKQRIFVKNCIDYLVKSKADFVYCYPKRKEWVYLLHHIHYKTENKKMQEFINAIRNNINNSVESGFESLMNKKEYIKAAELLIKEKGQGMFLRNIQYILTRTTKEEDVKKVISLIDTDNNIILLSLLKLFGQDKELDRIFVFYNEKKMKSFREDKSLRKYFLSKRKIQLLKAKINEA